MPTTLDSGFTRKRVPRNDAKKIFMDAREFIQTGMSAERFLVVPPEPKPFATAHAIHLLFTAPHLVEEVED